MSEIFKAFKDSYQYYLHRVFRITKVHVDVKFRVLKSLIESISGVPLVNLTVSNEYVLDTERRIRVVKEKCGATSHGLLFQKIPKILTTPIVLNRLKMINFFPKKGGISDSIRPKTIMPGDT